MRVPLVIPPAGPLAPGLGGRAPKFLRRALGGLRGTHPVLQRPAHPYPVASRHKTAPRD